MSGLLVNSASTDIELYAFDSVNPGRVSVEIWSVSGASVGTKDLGKEGFTTVKSGAINHTIPAEVQSLIHLNAFISHASQNLGLYSVKINYTYSP